MKFLESLFGPNWRTTLSGGITVLASAIYSTPALVSFLPPSWQSAVTGIAGLISVLAGGTFAAVSKDRAVTGNGSAFEPHKVIQADGSNRIIEPAPIKP